MSKSLNRYRVVLHIGISKTGSSALQYFFAKYSSLLLDNDIFYYVPNKDVVNGKIESGNAEILLQYLRPEIRNKNFKEEMFYDKFSDTYFKNSQTILLSNENLYLAHKSQIKKFSEFLKPYADLTVIAYVRDFYGKTYASWMQGIKRHGRTNSFVDSAKKIKIQTSKDLEAWRSNCNDFRVGHYNSARNHLVNDFLERTDLKIPTEKIQLPPKVNRSLDFKECVLLSKLNQFHKGRYSRELSDTLLLNLPDKETPLPIIKEIADRMKEEFSDQVDWINKKFFQENQLQVIDNSGDIVDNIPEVEIPKEDELLYKKLCEMLEEKDKLAEEYRARLFFWQARFHVEKNNNDKAIAMLKQCLKTKPNWEEAKKLLQLAKSKHK